MKGIILELRTKHTIILTKEGDFKKIPTESRFTHIGQEVKSSIKKKVTFSNHIKYAASFLIFVLLFTFYFSNQSEVYAYVTIDTNPSLELAINQHQKVLSISALNDDAKSIIKDIDYKNHTVIEVVQSIAVITIQKKYLIPNNNQKFVITTISRDPNDLEIQKLNAKITHAAAEVIQDQALIVSQNTTSEKRQQALKKHTSTGKIVYDEENNNSSPPQSKPNNKPKYKSPSRILNTRKNQNQNRQKNHVNKAHDSKKKQDHNSKKNKDHSKSNHPKK